MVSYRYCSYLYYCMIHLRRCIRCYFPLTHDDFYFFYMFYFKLSWDFYFIKIIKSVHLWYYWTKIVLVDKVIHYLWFLIINNKCRNKGPVIKPSDHWKTEHYLELADCCEGDPESELNCLTSGNLWQYTTVLSQFDRFPWTWTWRLLYLDCWSHFEKFPGSV